MARGQYRIGRIVQYEFGRGRPGTARACWRCAKEIDAAVRAVLAEGNARGEFQVDSIADTTLALLSLCIGVARWYQPGSKRTPEEIGATYGRLGLRLVGVT